jgi:hypothetical protein
MRSTKEPKSDLAVSDNDFKEPQGQRKRVVMFLEGVIADLKGTTPAI